MQRGIRQSQSIRNCPGQCDRMPSSTRPKAVALQSHEDRFGTLGSRVDGFHCHRKGGMLCSKAAEN